jgi:hypothetical protein
MIKHEYINDFYNEEGELSKPLENKLNWCILGSSREDDFKVHEILEDIINKHKNGKVGIVNELEGGLTIDYIDIDTNKECRFILGFTELGYWCYCNTYKENLVIKEEKKEGGLI